MTETERPLPSVIAWGCAGRALGDPREGSESGDLQFVVDLDDGALVAVIDGLGHGTEAAAAAKVAAQILEAHAAESVLELMRRCHEGLRKTRGAVMSLACFSASASSITWIGVGNVEGALLRAAPTAHPPREDLSMRGGVVGYQLPTLRATEVFVAPGDTLILATDGIRSGFTTGLSLERSPQEIADDILARHWRLTDDALVLVARYLGSAL
jgi:serine phosphatase RsbU (regulator of sigma subunit)